MRTRTFHTLIAATVIAAGLAAAAHAEVGVAIGFSQPGVYGRVDIGQYPQPQLVIPEPVLIERPSASLPPPEPFYLWVPADERMHWRKYCHKYHACGHPVYFVHDDWYHRTVVAHPERREGARHEEMRHEEARHDEARKEDRDHPRREEDRDRDRARERE